MRTVTASAPVRTACRLRFPSLSLRLNQPSADVQLSQVVVCLLLLQVSVVPITTPAISSTMNTPKSVGSDITMGVPTTQAVIPNTQWGPVMASGDERRSALAPQKAITVTRGMTNAPEHSLMPHCHSSRCAR